MKKYLFQIISFIFLFLISYTPIFAEQINSFTTDATIKPDGTIEVAEKITYDFGNDQRHGIFRNIDRVKENTDGKKFVLDISILAVTDADNMAIPYTQTTDGEYITLKIGDPDRTITGTHVYKIGYRVRGAITYFSEHDELYWNATGNEWEVPINTAVSTIMLPAQLPQDQLRIECFTGQFGSIERDCLTAFSGNTVSVTNTRPFGAEEGMSYVVGFPKGLVSVIEPTEYKTFFETLMGKIVLLLLLILAFLWYLVYPIWIMIKWWMTGRDPKTGGSVTAWYDPPSTPDGRKLLPAEAGTLIDEMVNMRDISATIVDMARRGFLRIEERKKRDFYLVKTDPAKKDKPLTSYELLLYEALFAPGNFKPTLDLITNIFKNNSAGIPVLSLEELQKTFTKSSGSTLSEVRLKNLKLVDAVKDIEKVLYNTVVAEGFFDKNPHATRTFYTGIGSVALFTFNIPLAFVAFVIGRHMPKKTLHGAREAAVAKSLKNFLDGQERQLTFQAKNQMWFEKLLPYAVAYGVEKHWAEQFKDIALAAPTWYSTYNNRPFNSIYFTNSLNSSFTSIARAATPTSSSSGFSSGFSGGSSGGGGGGGGGGSW